MRRRRIVLGGWALVVVAAALTIATLLGTALTAGKPESQRAEQLLHEAFAPKPGGARAGAGTRGEFHANEAVIVTSQRGLTASDPRWRARP